MRKLIWIFSIISILSLISVSCNSWDEPVAIERSVVSEHRFITPEEACQYASEAFARFGFEGHLVI